MSKRTTSNSGGLLAKKPKLDDLNDFWDDDFDGDAVDDCFKEVSQQVKDSGDVTLVSSYTAFKERKNVLTSTELSASTAGEVDIVETIRELKEKYAQKEGEVSILRSNLQSLRTSCIIDQEKKQMEWKEKIDKAEKENKSIKSELEFKNLEIVNLKQRLVEVSRAATVVEQNFTQKSQNIDCDLLLQNSTKSTFCPEISSRICVNFEKHYPLKPFSVLFRTKDIYTMNSNVRSSNKVDHIANSQKHNIFKYDKVDMSYLYQELTSFVTMSVEELDSETLAPSIYRALQSLRNLLKNLHNQLKDVKAELFFENKKDVDIFYPQRHSLNEVIEASSNLLEFFGELLPYNKKVKNYFLDEKLFLENIPTSSVTEENDTTNILILLSQIIFTIGPLGSRNFSLFIENCIKLFCKSLCLEDSGFLIQNILKQIPISVYYVNHNLRYQVIFLSICSRNHSFVNLFCSYYKDKQEYCKFHNFADSLEDKLLNMEDTKLFIQISCNIINITYNISRKDYLLIQQQDNKVCGCISKLFKLTILIIYKILKLYNLHHFKYPLLQRHIKILIFLMFNAYDFTQESIGDHAVFKEIVYTLVHLDVKIDNLKDLEKLCAKEEFPTVPKEKFKNVCF